MAEDNNLVPKEIEEVIDQAMAVGGERQLVMKEYSCPISCIQLGDAA